MDVGAPFVGNSCGGKLAGQTLDRLQMIQVRPAVEIHADIGHLRIECRKSAEGAFAWNYWAFNAAVCWKAGGTYLPGCRPLRMRPSV
ncbi:Uncharacterized protein TCM_001926 [Theobroma cacao]|uniref:Uncharacterized protein n=1 Tax=Theobroma cacao TaxID=3641 RepID=A0A061DKW5_THECC|nr:Uncharacterized protein TCM_001926 [Theobroma cacao]